MEIIRPNHKYRYIKHNVRIIGDRDGDYAENMEAVA